MRIVRTVSELREALKPARLECVGFVPTMGALHEGHLSLVRAARQENTTVVMSIFVNPTQFEDPKDLAGYIRDQARDEELAKSAGVDVVFAPSVAEMYPTGFSTTVRIDGPVTESLEAIDRGRSFFDGIATVVAKLLLAVLPDTVYFGEKDAQQVAVVRRLVEDLNIPVTVAVCETARDDDGLAKSSRNVRLSDDERERARAIPKSLDAIRSRAAAGESNVTRLRRIGTEILSEAGGTLNYLAFTNPVTLEEVATVEGPTLVLVAVTIGETRLIDNVLLTPNDTN